MMRTMGALAALLVVLAPEQATAKRAAKGNGAQIAIFLTPQAGADAKLSAAVGDALIKAAGERAVAGKTLKRLLKRKPEAAIGKCGSNLTCIAKLGKQARARDVLFGRVVPAGAGVRVEVLVVSVASQAIDRKVAFEVDSAASAAARVAEKHTELFGAPAVAAEGGGEELSLDMIQATPLAQAATSEPAAAGAEPAATPEPPLAPEAAPAAADPMDSLELAELPTKPTVVAPAAEVAAVQADLPGAPDGGPRSRTITYAGITVAGLGAVSLGIGAFFGMKSRSLPDTITRGGGGTTQDEGIAAYEDSDRAGRRANLFFAIGGAAVAVGAALVSVDLLVLGDSTTPRARIELGATPDSAWVRYAW